MQRTSWWEDAERFRNLDELVERSPHRLRSASRWSLVAAVAALAGLAGWYGMDRGGAERVSPLSKFDQVLARHTPQHVDESESSADDKTRSNRPSSMGSAWPNQPEQPSSPGAADHAPMAEEPFPGEPPAPELDPAPTSQPGGYHIQVASLRSKKRAELLCDRLQREGHHATLEAIGLRNRGWWHSVRIGPFDSRIEAEVYRLEFDPFQGRITVVVPRAKGRYHVQVASVRSQEKAESLVEQLRRRGHHARRQRSKMRGTGAWHTVRIGPFETRPEAEAYRAHFAQREDTSAVVVPFELLEPGATGTDQDDDQDGDQAD